MEEDLIVDAPSDIIEPVDAPAVICGTETVPVQDSDDTECETKSQMVDARTFFGTLQESVPTLWRFHLMTDKYVVHRELEYLYHEMLSRVDELIEKYQGIYGLIADNLITAIGDKMYPDPEQYLRALKEFIGNNRCAAGNADEINSVIDDILGAIDSTLYKITMLHESNVKSFDEFCYEDLKESALCPKFEDFGGYEDGDCGDSDECDGAEEE